MRVSAMVIGILFSIWTFFEALLITGLSNAADDDETSSAGAGGLIAAVVAGVASMLVLALPLFSAVTFVVAGLISFAAAAAGYSNHWFYGSIFIVLGVMAFFGWIGKRKERRENQLERLRQVERDNRMETLMRQQRDEVRYPAAGQQTSLGGRNHAALATVDNATKIAIANLLDPDEDARFAVSGSNATLIGADRSLILIPSGRKGFKNQVQAAYAAVTNVRVETARKGGTLRFDVDGQTHEIVLANQVQVDQGTEAVRLLRQITRRAGAVAVEPPINAQVAQVTFPNFCPSCKHRNEHGVKFCAECGTTMIPTPAH